MFLLMLHSLHGAGWLTLAILAGIVLTLIGYGAYRDYADRKAK